MPGSLYNPLPHWTTASCVSKHHQSADISCVAYPGDVGETAGTNCSIWFPVLIRQFQRVTAFRVCLRFSASFYCWLLLVVDCIISASHFYSHGYPHRSPLLSASNPISTYGTPEEWVKELGHALQWADLSVGKSRHMSWTGSSGRFERINVVGLCWFAFGDTLIDEDHWTLMSSSSFGKMNTMEIHWTLMSPSWETSLADLGEGAGIPWHSHIQWTRPERCPLVIRHDWELPEPWRYPFVWTMAEVGDVLLPCVAMLDYCRAVVFWWQKWWFSHHIRLRALKCLDSALLPKGAEWLQSRKKCTQANQGIGAIWVWCFIRKFISEILPPQTKPFWGCILFSDASDKYASHEMD